MKRLVKLFGILLVNCLTIITVYAQKPDVDLLLKQATIETNASNYQRAIDIADSALVLSPDYTDIRLLLGRLYVLIGDYPKARKQLLWVVEKNPSNLDALNYLINIESINKDPKQAIAYIDQALLYSNSQDLILKKSGLLESDNQFKAAYLVLEPLISNSNTDTAVIQSYINMRLKTGKGYLQANDIENARNEYFGIVKRFPENEDALSQLYGLEVESKNYEKGLSYADLGLKYHPNSENFLFKKAAVLATMSRPFDAYKVAKVLTKQYPDNEKAQLLLSDLYASSRKNRIGISYDYTFFDQAQVSAWSLASIYYTREERSGTISAKLNYADRGVIGRNGYQFEIEAYPKHGKNYSFINMAYSNALIFPKLRLGYSYYSNFKNGWESEIGIRYINASGNNFISYGGAVGKYFKNYWFNFRPFFTYQDKKIYSSVAFTTRKYLDQRDNYFSLILGAGSSADDRNRDFQLGTQYNLSSYRASIGFQHLVLKTTILGVLGTINNQELVPDKRRNEFDVFLNLQHKF